MDTVKMNRQLGTKWFTFYTKVRPWLSCLMAFVTLRDFLQYTDVYLSHWWLLLHFLASVTLPILCIIVAIKSDGDYVDFVRFVKSVLLFETIAIAYGKGVQEYIASELDIGSAAIMFVLILVIGYFVWYRLNVKYFEKRIITTIIGTGTATNIQQDSYLNNSVVFKPETNKMRFCIQCGEKLIDGSRFCGECGTEVIKEKSKEREDFQLGLFGKKQEITVEDMAMKMMLAASEAIGKLTAFNEVSDTQNMIVGMGYFYAFLKMNLNSITSLDTANAIVEKSITNLTNATKNNPEFANFGKTVKAIADNAVENMKYTTKTFPQDPFMGMSVFYMSDMYGSNTVNVDKVDVSTKNLQLLYGMTSNLTKDVKIVK